jgi:hypothetical protein
MNSFKWCIFKKKSRHENIHLFKSLNSYLRQTLEGCQILLCNIYFPGGWNRWYFCSCYWICLIFFFFAVLGFELRAYTLSQSSSPFLWWVFSRWDLQELFAQAGFELWSSWSLPPEYPSKSLAILVWLVWLEGAALFPEALTGCNPQVLSWKEEKVTEESIGCISFLSLLCPPHPGLQFNPINNICLSTVERVTFEGNSSEIVLFSEGSGVDS